jgi:hypothetical protein
MQMPGFGLAQVAGHALPQLLYTSPTGHSAKGEKLPRILYSYIATRPFLENIQAAKKLPERSLPYSQETATSFYLNPLTEFI